MKTKNKTPEELFDENRGLVYHIAFKYKHPPEAEEDMIQEGLIALWRAAQQYDPSNGAAFTTYAGTAIARAYNAWLPKAWNSSGLSASSDIYRKAYSAKENGGEMPPHSNRIFETVLSTEYKVRRNDSLRDNLTIGDSIPVEDDHTEMFQEEARAVLMKAVMKLDPEDRDVLILRFGLDGEPPILSNQELADVLGLERKQVGWALKRAKNHLSKIATYSMHCLLDE